MGAYLLLMGSAFGAQALLFVPLVPLLVSAGVLASQGELRVGWAVAAAAAGVAAGDFLWYQLGRRSGSRVLGRVCRMAVEPDTCVRRSENLFSRYGARALVVAKFIPGLSTVALPLAGVFRMRPRRFVLYDAIGVTLWSFAYVMLGYFAAEGLAAAGAWTPRVGWPAVLLTVALAAAYIAWRYVQRMRLMRALRVARITPEELWQRMGAGADIAILDLRHPIDFETDPATIPGAVYIPAEDLRQRHGEIPRHREVVLYCTCPDEVTSAKEALRLRRRGFTRVRPLQGGFTAWRAKGYPVDSSRPPVPEEERILNAA